MHSELGKWGEFRVVHCTLTVSAPPPIVTFPQAVSLTAMKINCGTVLTGRMHSEFHRVTFPQAFSLTAMKIKCGTVLAGEMHSEFAQSYIHTSFQSEHLQNKMWHCVDRWNAQRFNSECSVQMNILCSWYKSLIMIEHVTLLILVWIQPYLIRLSILVHGWPYLTI